MDAGRGRTSRRRVAAFASLVAASAFGMTLVVFRAEYTGELLYANLVWNLVLAWVPFVLAIWIYDRARRDRRLGPASLLLGAAWLAFLPNAPYLVTDFMLLRDIGGMPVWYDVALLTTFAWTGLLLGFVSVYLVQQSVARVAGAATGWLCALAALGLSGLGVYLGRYLRWNSWDLLVQPREVLADIALRLDSSRLVGMSLVMAVFLIVAYGMLYTVLQAALDERDLQ